MSTIGEKLLCLIPSLSELACKGEISAEDRKTVDRVIVLMKELGEATFIDQRARKELMEALKEAARVCGSDEEVVGKIEGVMSEILIPSKEAIKRPKIGLNLVFCSDLSAPDYNGAITLDIESAARGKTPFIAPRSLLSDQGRRQFGEPVPVDIPKHQRAIMEHAKNWDLFRKGEYILFLPKSLLPQLTAEEKLKALDFRSDGSLESIGIEEAFREPTKKPIWMGSKGFLATNHK